MSFCSRREDTQSPYLSAELRISWLYVVLGLVDLRRAAPALFSLLTTLLTTLRIGRDCMWEEWEKVTHYICLQHFESRKKSSPVIGSFEASTLPYYYFICTSRALKLRDGSHKTMKIVWKFFFLLFFCTYCT